MTIKCRFCRFWERLPAIVILILTGFAACFVFSITAQRVSDLEQDPAWLELYQTLVCVSTIGVLFMVFILLVIAFDELNRTVNKWRQECQDETEATT